MWEVDPMNPNESILEHLGMTGEEYRQLCRANMLSEIELDAMAQKYMDDLANCPVVIRPIARELGTFEKTTYIPPNVDREAMVRTAIKKFYDEHPGATLKLISADFEAPVHSMEEFLNMINLSTGHLIVAPETQSTDEEEIIWPI